MQRKKLTEMINGKTLDFSHRISSFSNRNYFNFVITKVIILTFISSSGVQVPWLPRNVYQISATVL